MMRIFFTLLVVSIVPLFALDTFDLVLDDAFNAVCNVMGYDDEPGEYRFNAFFIDSRGYLITNKEIALKCDKILCRWKDVENNIQDLEAHIVSVHPEYNLALIKVDVAEGERFPFLNVNFTPLCEGQWLIRASRHSQYGSHMPTISSVRAYFEKPSGDFLAHEGRIDIGCNDIRILGAPYLNLEGNVVAVHCGHYKRTSYFTALYPLKRWLNNQLKGTSR